ncbi:hypothetical protein D3C78_1630240 [compost metagenome]
MGQLLHAFEAQEGAAQHQQRRHRPRQKGADQERRRHQDQLIDERTPGHRPHDGQFPVDRHAGHLLRVQRQVVAQHPGGFLGRHFGHDGDVVQNRGDVVE